MANIQLLFATEYAPEFSDLWTFAHIMLRTAQIYLR